MTDPTDQYDDLAQREANTEAFIEEHASILCDPANEWCEPAIEFARWNAEDTEGLRSDQERDSARHHAILQITVGDSGRHLQEMFGTDPDFGGISLRYLAELIVDHFETVYSDESADDPEITDGEEIPFEAPAVVLAKTPDADVFQQVDDLIRSHFGLQPKPRF